MASQTHILCYIRRRLLTDWKIDSLDRGTRNQPILAYGSNDSAFAKYAKKGSVLWVIGAHQHGPPSLEAKIEVAGELNDSEERQWSYEVRGSRSGSSFLGMNDASSALMQLVFQNRDSTWSLRDKHGHSAWKNIYGRLLQAPRRLAAQGERVNSHRSSGAAPLERCASRAMDRAVFISWKHADSNRNRQRFMRALSMDLVKCGFSVWWDRTALTDVEVVEEYQEKDEVMNRLLRQGISRSTAVLALWTENYGTRSTPSSRNWTREEWHVHNGARRIALVPGDFESKTRMAEPDRVIRIPQNPQPEEAARIARQFKRAYSSISDRR